MNAGAPLLEIRDLSRTFPQRGGRAPTAALDGVSFDMAPGEILGIVGASGCGKSTLARIVATLDRPSAGTVALSGTAYGGMTDAALRPSRGRVQMVFQDPYGSLDPRMSIFDSVAEPLALQVPALDRAARRERVEAVLAEVGLPVEAATRKPHAFSGGQRQRIAIARAIATRPELVVADEAVSALDLSVQAQIVNLFLDLQDRGTAILFISHDLAVVSSLADRIAVMDAGRIVEIGRTADIIGAPAHPVTRALLAARL